MIDRDFVALDCEMTGFSPEKDKLIEVGATRFTLEADGAEFDELMNPGVKIPAVVARLTGIRDEELEVAEVFATHAPAIATITTDATIVGHNIRFDLEFLRTHGLDITSQATFDTYDLASLVLPRGPSMSLIGLVHHLGLTHDSAHRALSDAAASRDLFRALVALGQQFGRDKWERIAALPVTAESWLQRFARVVLDAPTLPAPTVNVQADATNDAPISNELRDTIADLVARDSQSLFETTASIDELSIALTQSNILKATPQQFLISCAGQFEARTVAERIKLPLLFAPRHYIDPERFAAFTQCTLSPVEAAFAAKLILHTDAPFFAFNFNRAEQLLWDFVAADTLTDELRTRLGEASVVVTYHGALRELIDAEPTLAEERRIIVTSATYLPTALSRVEALTLDMPALETLVPEFSTQLAMWWGLLGVLLKESESLYGQVLLDDVRGLPAYARMAAAGLSFVEAARDRLPPALIRTIETYLGDTPGYARGLRTDSGNNLTISCDPLPDAAAAKILVAKLPRAIFIDSALAIGDDYTATRALLSLPADTHAVGLSMPEPRPVLATVSTLPEPTAKNVAKEVEAKLIELANTLPGITTIVFPGRYQLGIFHEFALTRITRPLIAEKLSGSQSKIELLLREHETAIYLTTSTLLPAPATKNLILVRLPYDRPPSETQLASQLLGFKKMYACLRAVRDRPADQQLIVLDTRIVNTDIGKKFASVIGCDVVGV